MENSSRAHSGVRSTNAWNQTHISGNASVHQGDVFQVGSDLEKVCLSRLRVVDPRDHGAGIERKKGGLCEEAFKWILDTRVISTDKALNNATAVLRSLIWLFAVQQPDIMSPLLERYKVSGTELFTDGNSFDALSAIFQAMLKDSNMSPMYFAIDALDECDENQSDLIKIIATSLTISSKVKWLLASRPEVDVLAKLKTYDLPDLCIPKALVELDTESLQAPASAYIEHRLKKLKRSSNVGSTYTEAILETVLKEVRERAKDNFLWVSLVFDDLETMRGPYAINQVLGYPSGLSQLYDHRMDRIERKETGGRLVNRVTCISPVVS
ncbi:unnamed protein product [Parascedosporium putredinis]|uniref:Nephrocystin 3-like N-terminal domain-containing protein n=1 Tax=Parascedosporium putredinis TaxID=1442378 RepID=A0A9P1H1J6_9PEZI|nr:unnamed protein product [Parascedosporium putredinis]CAI7993779.1 unnamed protein product [Parascedosporium putredinis]